MDAESPGPPARTAGTTPGVGARLRSRLADLLALLVALGSLLALGEMAVRPFYVPPPPRPAPQVRAQYSPRFGWTLVPDPAAWSLAERAPVNARGLRGPDRAYDRGPDSTVTRWLFLGGGSTFGVGVAGPATFAAVAARAVAATLPESVEVINAGCEGYDPGQCVRWLALEGRFYRPDAIVLTFEPEDLPPAGHRDTLFTAERFAAVARRVNRAPDAPAGFLDGLLRRSRLASFLATRFTAFQRLGRRAESAGGAAPGTDTVRLIDLLQGREPAVLERAWETVGEEFAALGRAARPLGAAVYVVALPLPPQLSRDYPHARYQERVAEICRRNEFVLIDPLPEMRAARQRLERLYLPRLPFLSAAGHRVVAQRLVGPLSNPELLRTNWQLPSQAGE